jgi:hypothetical protein
MAALDRDLRVGCFIAIFGLIVGWISFTMPSRGGFVESPGIFPGLMAVLLVLFGTVLAWRSLKKGGRLHLVRLVSSVIPFMTAPEHRAVMKGILFPAIYVFAGIPVLGFYPSSALFLTIMFYCFVTKWRRRFLFLPIAIGLTGLLYLIFNKLFMLQIR